MTEAMRALRVLEREVVNGEKKKTMGAKIQASQRSSKQRRLFAFSTTTAEGQHLQNR